MVGGESSRGGGCVKGKEARRVGEHKQERLVITREKGHPEEKKLIDKSLTQEADENRG